MIAIAVLAAVGVLSTCTGASATSQSSTTVAGRSTATKGVVKGAIKVTFDRPGKSPRPIREKVVALRTPATTLTMTIEKVTYPGMVCGFTFHGARPPSPVTIRVQGATRRGPFDSGELAVAWQPTSPQETSSASSGDSGSGWSFLSAANVDRSTGSGWVVSVGAVAQDKANIPTAATCALTAPVAFARANGPVGYWAGFATT